MCVRQRVRKAVRIPSHCKAYPRVVLHSGPIPPGGGGIPLQPSSQPSVEDLGMRGGGYSHTYDAKNDALVALIAMSHASQGTFFGRPNPEMGSAVTVTSELRRGRGLQLRLRKCGGWYFPVKALR